MKLIFVADFFVNKVLGGGELNNDELKLILKSKNIEIEEIESHLVTREYILNNKHNKFVIFNFVNLNQEHKDEIMNHDYIIYEHDHKYIRTRNPGLYRNFVAPKSDIVNYLFYKNAKRILCQSSFHKQILQKNLNLYNVESLSGNLWPIECLRHMDRCRVIKKINKAAIMDSTTPHKNTHDARKYCEHKNIPYNLIPMMPYNEFLSFLGKHNKFVFLPKTPETLSRVIVEARIMNLKIITNKMVGATKEEWYSKPPEQLLEHIFSMREHIPNKVLECFR